MKLIRYSSSRSGVGRDRGLIGVQGMRLGLGVEDWRVRSCLRVDKAWLGFFSFTRGHIDVVVHNRDVGVSEVLKRRVNLILLSYER